MNCCNTPEWAAKLVATWQAWQAEYSGCPHSLLVTAAVFLAALFFFGLWWIASASAKYWRHKYKNCCCLPIVPPPPEKCCGGVATCRYDGQNCAVVTGKLVDLTGEVIDHLDRSRGEFLAAIERLNRETLQTIKTIFDNTEEADKED